jgi:nucleoside-diphosphate-sugar epimerase
VKFPDKTHQSKPIIFGASGFIGKHVIQEVGLLNCIPVSRHANENGWVEADLLKPHSIESALTPGGTVMNLTYSQQASPEENIQMANNLIHACKQANIKRLVHCSTAVVVGKNPAAVVNEESICYPETRYEKTKYAIEKIFLAAATTDFTVHILRPTGVIGRGGQNLKKMLSIITHGNPVMNVIRSSVFGARQLNLVPVNDVVRALLHLCDVNLVSSGVYICSADDDAESRYNEIEALIRTWLTKSPVKTVHLPAVFLESLLRYSRSGSQCFPNRRYSAAKLAATGFKRTVPVVDAIREFVLSEIQ